jgi:hypothetical protein
MKKKLILQNVPGKNMNIPAKTPFSDVQSAVTMDVLRKFLINVPPKGLKMIYVSTAV